MELTDIHIGQVKYVIPTDVRNYITHLHRIATQAKEYRRLDREYWTNRKDNLLVAAMAAGKKLDQYLEGKTDSDIINQIELFR